MRPKSIILFERLYLASLAIAILVQALDYSDMMAALAKEPTFREAGVGGGAVIGLLSAAYAGYLLLWFLTARVGLNAVKWILVVLTALDVFVALRGFGGPWDTMLVLTLAVRVLEVAAVAFLFQPDAVAWLTRGRKSQDPADPATAD